MCCIHHSTTLKKRGRLTSSHHPIITATLAGVAKSTGADVRDRYGCDISSYEDNYLSDIQPDWVGLIPFEHRREMLIEPSLELVQYLREARKREIWLPNCPLHSEESKTGVRGGMLDFAVFGDSEALYTSLPTGSWTGAGLCVQNGDAVSEFDPCKYRLDVSGSSRMGVL